MQMRAGSAALSIEGFSWTSFVGVSCTGSACCLSRWPLRSPVATAAAVVEPQTAKLKGIRTGRHYKFDRIVLDLRGPVPSDVFRTWGPVLRHPGAMCRYDADVTAWMVWREMAASAGLECW